MTRQEFADNWGYQSGVGYGCAQFDCRESLLKDLNVLIADEVKNLALPQVSVANRKVCPKCGETKDIEHIPDHYDCHSCGEEF